MQSRRRRIGLVAILAVLWATLWPLVASTRALVAGDEMPLCHQAGMQVAMDSMTRAPHAPEAPNPETTTHCPLCIMAFYASFAGPLAQPQFIRMGAAVALETYCAPATHRLAAYLPESRAPPRS